MKKIFLLFLVISNICFSQVNLNLGLRAYYPFSGNANDVSGNNNNPVFNNATLTADRFGNANSAYHFNGTDSYMKILNNPTINTTNTLSLVTWVKPIGFYMGKCHGNQMIMKGDADYLTGNYQLRFDDNAYTSGNNCSTPLVDVLHQNFYGNGVNAAPPGYTPYIQTNQWYSVIVTYDGTVGKLYINCELKVTTAQGSAIFTNAYDLYFGHLNNAQYPYWLNGDLDEIRIYDRALTVDEVNVLGGCVAPDPCDTWLYTPTVGSSAKIGDLDVSGNQITVEAQFIRTAPYTGNYSYAGDIVSKHDNPNDINYLLRPNNAEITTTNGYFSTPEVCLMDLNKTYHVALVYNGSVLKFYRNGFLLSQVPATGNLILNDYITTIGDYAFPFPDIGTNFVGYINEVRIWNVARTQAEVQAYMNAPLPTPASQTGLFGYYVFNDLLNKQGNTAFNAILNGAAAINATNPNCTFTPDPGLVANAGIDTSFCSNTPVSHVLQGNGNGTYSWSPAIYLDNPNIQNPTATINFTTTFYLSVSIAGFCSVMDSVTIFVNPLPSVQTLTDTAICKFSPLVLNTTSNATTFLWSPAIYVSNPAIANPAFIDTASHRLYVTATSSAGCSATDSIDITVNPLPVVSTLADTTICLNQTITLSANGAQAYAWTPPGGLSNPTIANPVFSGTTNQTYTVTGTDANGCKGADMINIYVSSPTSFNAPPSKMMCQQKSVQLDGNNGTRVSYLWSPAVYLSNDTIINPVANPPQTTLYTLVVTDNSCGYDSTFTTQVTVLPAPIVSAGKSNDIDCTIHSATLNATGGNQYTWSPSTGLNSTTISNPVASPVTTQKYIVLVADAFGCTNSDSVSVFVTTGANIGKFMPNSFTPNGDGLNDCYGLKNWGQILQLQFYIFNRYGEQVFATANPGKCWDGTYKGKPALAGTYVYVIKATTDCGIEEQKGNFLLIR